MLRFTLAFGNRSNLYMIIKFTMIEYLVYLVR